MGVDLGGFGKAELEVDAVGVEEVAPVLLGEA